MEGIRMQENVQANTAKSFCLVGLIFYALITLGALIAIIVITWLFAWIDTPMNGTWGIRGPWTPWEGPNITILIGLLIGLVLIVNAFFTYWAYRTYKKVDEGNYADARSAALMLGLFGLLFGGFLGGLFFLLAYSKLGNVLRERDQIPLESITGIPESAGTKYCVSCNTVIRAHDHFCENCGSKQP